MTQWHLRTRATSYVVSSLPDESGVVLDYWGPVLAEGVDSAPWSEPERIVSFSAAADVQPLEYASNGQRHGAFSELLVDRGSGHTGASWTLLPDGVSAHHTHSGQALTLPFQDETGTLRLELRFATSSQHDVIRRSATVHNQGDATVELTRAFSAAWNLPLGQHVHIDYLAGSWGREFQQRSTDLHWGTFSIGSRQGTTSLLFSPVVAVTAAVDADSYHRPSAHAYGIALDWSGAWRLQVDSAAVGQHARVSCGVDDDVTTVTLLPGESYRSPDSLGVFSDDGRQGLTDAWHDFQRSELTRDHTERARPVVYNSWYATGFDVTVEHQQALARQAAELGVETFVVDDGWFVGRTSDRAGLGDWRPDPVKFPNGLNELVEAVEELGMRFGIWIEPECVNPDSDLYRTHPDWVYGADGRPLLTIRNQYVLDLGREEVANWVMSTLRTLLGSTSIGYLKWDMNRPITDGGRPGDPHGREWSLQHTRNYYRVLDMVRAEFPDVIFEACSAGGARIDNAVLQRSDIVWTSDQVGPRDRLVIQDGFLTAYPSWVMSSWVTDDPGHRDRQPISLGYSFAVAMAGVLGIGSDLSSWSEEQKREAAARVAAYKGIRGVVHHGRVRRHGAPDQGLYCVEYHGPDDDPRVVLFVYDRDRDRARDRERARVFPSSLRTGVVYAVGDADGRPTGDTVTRELAAVNGVPVDFTWAKDADVIVLTPQP
ncbi:alpha-galactosidase [Humibacter soli]